MKEHDCYNAPRTAPISDTGCPTLDLEAIRRTLQRGEPVFPALIGELCDRVEVAEAYSAVHHTATECIGDYVLLLAAARAWRDAMERMDGIVAAEERLLEAIKGCES